jgi:hypothetical protein
MKCADGHSDLRLLGGFLGEPAHIVRRAIAVSCGRATTARLTGVIDDDVNVVPSDALLPVTRLIADALAPNHPFARPT